MSELTPYLCVEDARKAIDWYAEALGATMVYEPVVMDDGRIGHAEMDLAGARWMMAEEFPDVDVASPDPNRGAAVSLHLTVEDVDAVAERVVAAGVTLDRGPEDAEYAGRMAVFHDPFGHRWLLNAPASA